MRNSDVERNLWCGIGSDQRPGAIRNLAGLRQKAGAIVSDQRPGAIRNQPDLPSFCHKIVSDQRPGAIRNGVA